MKMQGKNQVNQVSLEVEEEDQAGQMDEVDQADQVDQVDQADQENQMAAEDLGEKDQNTGTGQLNPPGPQEGVGHKSKVTEPDIFMGDYNKANKSLSDLYFLFCSQPKDYPNDGSMVVTALSYLCGDT
ncbi:hypothetical protein NUW54_g42 [Trametes sanguinea]|uniref:Uncharacterized protein n=1 Tax=Trametes sanguinea TaxID=158606 RepID=A0ACC1QAB0_9APHY|nr:hypothetical protein NUW54_g42 [Trametes sanguinea]